ncbi:terminase small subunit [Bdellovibrio bacteriovorus]
MKKLSPQQERFCEEYIIDLNATQAAIRAKYSEKSSRSIASELLTKPQIQERIIELKKARSERVQISADYVLNKLQAAADLDLLPLLKPDGSLKELKDIPEEIRKIIVDVERNPFTGEVLKYHFMSKLKCTEMLAKHTGVLKEKVVVSADETLAGLLAQVGKMSDESNGGA